MAANAPSVHNGSHEEPEDDVLNEHVHDPGDPDGLVAAEKMRQWQTLHPRPQPTPQAEYKPKRRWPIILVAVIVSVAVVSGAYWLGSRSADKHTLKPHARTSQVSAGPMLPITQTKHYDSTDFSLGFDYPADWTVEDTPAKLTVTSPAMPLMTAVGAKVDARVVVTIQNQQSSIPGFPSGGAVASLASDLLKYAQPSSVQRAQTYVSYLSYTQPNGLDMLFLTGNTGYQQGQAVPMSDIVQGDPLISVGFEKCSSSCSSSSDFVTLQASSWKSDQASQAVTNLIESIVISSS